MKKEHEKTMDAYNKKSQETCTSSSFEVQFQEADAPSSAPNDLRVQLSSSRYGVQFQEADATSSAPNDLKGQLSAVLGDLYNHHGLPLDKLVRISNYLSQPSKYVVAKNFLEEQKLPSSKINMIDGLLNLPPNM